MNLEQQLIQVQKECEQLRKENVALKNELEQYLPDKLADLSPDTVTNDSSPIDKVRLFRDLFKGRINLFAGRWETKAGKSG